MSSAQIEGLRRYWATRSPAQRAEAAERMRQTFERKRFVREAQPEPTFDHAAAAREQHLRSREREEREKAARDSNAFLPLLDLRAIGVAVRSRRGRQKPPMSQDELADAVGVTEWETDLIERGRLPYRYDFLAKLAGVFECQPGDLLTRGVSDIGQHVQSEATLEVTSRPHRSKTE